MTENVFSFIYSAVLGGTFYGPKYTHGLFGITSIPLYIDYGMLSGLPDGFGCCLTYYSIGMKIPYLL
jgi:hypothetical protein